MSTWTLSFTGPVLSTLNTIASTYNQAKEDVRTITSSFDKVTTAQARYSAWIIAKGMFQVFMILVINDRFKQLLNFIVNVN